MPANSGKLGFNCNCGKDYGSLEVVIPKNWHKKTQERYLVEQNHTGYKYQKDLN
jgi:hypothetical protein